MGSTILPPPSSSCVLLEIQEGRSGEYPASLTLLDWSWGWRRGRGHQYTYIPPWRRHDLIDASVAYDSYERVRSLEGYTANRDYFLSAEEVVGYILTHGFDPIAPAAAPAPAAAVRSNKKYHIESD